MEAGKSSSNNSISKEFLHAKSEIFNDVWNVSAWMSFIEEVKGGRSDISIEKGFRDFLNQFPRAYRMHRDFAEYLKGAGRAQEAKEEYIKIKDKCKDPDIWRSYLKLVDADVKDASSSKKLMDLYEQAIENVGMSVDAYPLWRDYIDLGRRRQLQFGDGTTHELRDIYQKALVNPMDELDSIWKEYEQWEKQMMNDISNAELVRNFSNAKAIFRDRKIKCNLNAIDFQRIAVKPNKSLEESTQLDLWNKWIRHERMNAADVKLIKLIFEQFLKCFLYLPEAWISYSRFASEIKEDAEALKIFEEAVNFVPNSAVLRVSKAELEESLGRIDQCKATLVSSFQEIPSGYTFTTLQRFLRRSEGKASGRKLFSETIGLRQKDKDKKLAFDIFMAHAQTELDANFDPHVAKKVLDMAKGADANASTNVRFVKLYVRCLLRIGDLNQIQWVMEDSINAISRLMSKHYSFISNSNNGMSGESGGFDASGSGGSSGGSVAEIENYEVKLLYDKYVLCDEYFIAEMTIALSDVNRLNKIRDMRDEARVQFEESLRGRSELLGANSELQKYRQKSLFHASFELTERSDALGTFLPLADEEIRERSKLVNYKHIDVLAKSQQRMLSAQRELLASRASAKDRQALKEDLKEVPDAVKDLLLELPPYPSFPAPDHAYIIQLLRSAALPASRPVLTDDAQATGGKRKKDEDDDDDDDDNFEAENFMVGAGSAGGSKKYDDIFRTRAKARHDASELSGSGYGANLSSFLI